MNTEQFSRTERILGSQAMDQIHKAKILVFGVGGVGGYTVEALARSGVGQLDLVDNDDIVISNLNRQIIALHSTIGKLKVDAFKERIHDISPETIVNVYPCFYLPETGDQFDFTKYDYIVDAIDTVTAKIDIICKAEREGVPVISAMGCGNRLDPTRLVITDIYNTKGDPLAKVMRYELKRRGIKKLPVVYSTEPPLKIVVDNEPQNGKRRSIPGSTAFVPSAACIFLASKIITDIIHK